MALARRADAAAVLLSPTIGYSACADEAQWRRALRAGGHGECRHTEPNAAESLGPLLAL